MKTKLLLFPVLLYFLGCTSAKRPPGEYFKTVSDNFGNESLVGPRDDDSYIVSTSQIIDPAGETVSFPGRAVDLALNPDETILAVKNMQNIVFFDVNTRAISQTLKIPRGGSSSNGIGWDSKNKLWITDSRGFLRSAMMNVTGSFEWEDEIFLQGPDNQGSYPGGFAIDDRKGIIYVALNRNNTIGVINLNSGKLEKQIPVGIAPYSVIIRKDKAYVTNWGGRQPLRDDMTHLSSGSPVVIDEKTGIASSGTVSVISLSENFVVNEITVKLHPCGMALSPDSSMLYVANANSDLVSVIDTEGDKVIRTISSKPMEELPFGSAPTDLVVAPDGKTLYIANGGDNLIVVYDIKENKLKGMIPAGWYPGAVSILKNGKGLFVANMKGIGSRQEGIRERGYNTHDQTGSVSFIPVPEDSDSLENYTIRAATNMRLPRISQSMNLSKVEEKIVPVPSRPGEKSMIRHIIYIIKENRTYDQILGDMRIGNGDSTLCMFGKQTTPNHHKLAEEFVLLDNTYCNGVLSAEGHNWTSQGYATDYLERAFPDWVRGYPWNGDDPMVYASTGFIWDNVFKAGLTFRTYGEFVSDQLTPGGATWSDLYNDYKSGSNKIKIRAIPTIHTLENNFCPTYTGSPRTINDQYKADEFIKELRRFEKTDSFPNLMMLSLPNNHTSGTQEGFPTPRAMVADNDLALGRIVEAVSKSRFWKETVIFVIEDDPQNGLDHVDGHRTVAFCISPYTKRGKVISTHYNQNSILRSIELILGLPPMSKFDLISMPMTNCFTDQPDFTPYEALKNNIPLDEMNPKLSSISGRQLEWAKKSMELRLDYNDDLNYAEEITLNKILWHSVKGYDVAYPGED